jgi:hypothetical protein
MMRNVDDMIFYFIFTFAVFVLVYHEIEAG